MAVKPLRDQLNMAHNEHRAALVAAAKTVSTILRATRGTVRHVDYFVIGEAIRAANLRNADHLTDDLMDVLSRTWTQRTGRFRAVTVADLDRTVGAAATNRTTIWRAGEATISIDGRTLRWDVPENNHAVDHAHGHPLAEVLFAALDKITWTRGTGGDIVGNNEYSRDSRDAGGGGNYVTRSYSAEAAKRRQAQSSSRFYRL